MRILSTVALCATATIAAAGFGVAPARADDCPGNPDALGTSRVLTLQPGEYSRVGIMQYPTSLPLADKEVVLTFDDGPLPKYSDQVLDILAAQCVKATYFLVGIMARAYPATVRRIHEAGHTIGTHTEHHPVHMERMPVDRVRHEIDGGIASVKAALWDERDIAPFFRIPGLARSDVIESEAAARSLVVFSSDTVADDWYRRIRPAEIVRRAMSRLEARGRGILLLHDIHQSTVDALPDLLKKLKEAGFHVVHVVPASGSSSRVELAGLPAKPPTLPAIKTEAAKAQAADTAADPPGRDVAETAADPANGPDAAAATAVAKADVDPPVADMNGPTADGVADMAGESAADEPDDPPWPKPVAVLIDDDRADLAVPDESVFAADYSPWRTVMLADESESARYFALAAVAQWADPQAVPLPAGEPELPVPAVPDYFGGGPTVTSIAE